MTLALLFFSVVEKVLNYDNATQILSFSLNLLWTVPVPLFPWSDIGREGRRFISFYCPEVI